MAIAVIVAACHVHAPAALIAVGVALDRLDLVNRSGLLVSAFLSVLASASGVIIIPVAALRVRPAAAHAVRVICAVASVRVPALLAKDVLSLCHGANETSSNSDLHNVFVHHRIYLLLKARLEIDISLLDSS